MAAPAPSIAAVGGEYPEHFAGGLLLTDLRIAFLLGNEARYRILERLFGISRDQANLATLAAGLVLLDAAHDKARQLLKVSPTRADVMIAAVVLDELSRAVTGASARETPLLTGLVGAAMLGALARPAAHGIRRYARRSRASFNHRYGRLIGLAPATRSPSRAPDLHG